MRNSKYTEEEKLQILLQHESGITVDEICKRFNISRSTFYKWHKKSFFYVEKFKTEKRQLMEENKKLREILQTQDKYIEELLRDILMKRFLKP
jgi:putative transposase